MNVFIHHDSPSISNTRIKISNLATKGKINSKSSVIFARTMRPKFLRFRYSRWKHVRRNITFKTGNQAAIYICKCQCSDRITNTISVFLKLRYPLFNFENFQPFSRSNKPEPRQFKKQRRFIIVCCFQISANVFRLKSVE